MTMLSEDRTGRQWRWNGLCWACLVAAAGAVTGCDARTEASRALQDATAAMFALGASAAQSTTPEHRAAVYQAVLEASRAGEGDGLAAEVAAARVLAAEASTGLAGLEAERLLMLERSWRTDAVAARAGMAHWQEYVARAEAAVFDPSPELARIDEATRQRERQIEAERSRLAQVQSQVDALVQQAERLNEEAQRLRTEEAELRRAGSALGAVEALERYEQAAKIGREADAIEVRAADLLAQADGIRPELGEIRLAIDRLVGEVELLARDRQSVTQRAELARQEAAEARADAARELEQVRAQVAELASAREGSLRQAADRAIELYQQALRSARQAVAEDPLGANLAIAEAQFGLGSVHWSVAQGYRAHGELVAMLAELWPEPEEASRLAGRARELRVRELEHLQQASAALRSAGEAYQAARLPSGAEEELQRLQGQLAGLVESLEGRAQDLAPAAEGEAHPAGG